MGVWVDGLRTLELFLSTESASQSVSQSVSQLDQPTSFRCKDENVSAFELRWNWMRPYIGT